ncbi:hypothetical protein ABBQ32_003653 [Trebouxia sp. C0010 RCD-2024]
MDLLKAHSAYLLDNRSSGRKHYQPPCPKATRLYSHHLKPRLLQLQSPANSIAGQLRCWSKTDRKDSLDATPPVSPDISMLRPELQQQWHVDSNMHLGAIKVSPSSAISAVWKCNKCPAGQPHVWKARVNNRTRGTKCPYCSNRRATLCLQLFGVALSSCCG